MSPAFCLSPIQRPPNLVPAAYVAQDLLFNQRRCGNTSGVSCLPKNREISGQLSCCPSSAQNPERVDRWLGELGRETPHELAIRGPRRTISGPQDTNGESLSN
jgi:hypothetical protein